jgi:hypothetical protein
MTTEDFEIAKKLIENIKYINNNILIVKHISPLTELRVTNLPLDRQIVYIPSELTLPIMELMLKHYNKKLELLEQELFDL